MARKHQNRNPDTGRYEHSWAFQGYVEGLGEFASCEQCEQWTLDGEVLKGIKKREALAQREKAQEAGVIHW